MVASSPETHYIDQVGSNSQRFSASQILGLKTCTTMPSFLNFSFFEIMCVYVCNLCLCVCVCVFSSEYMYVLLHVCVRVFSSEHGCAGATGVEVRGQLQKLFFAFRLVWEAVSHSLLCCTHQVRWPWGFQRFSYLLSS